MAISKSIELKADGVGTGVNVTHWVLDDINSRLIAGKVTARLTGYLSSVAYSQGKAKLDDRLFVSDLPGSFATMTGTQMIAAIENYILTQSEFTGGTRV